MEVRWGPTVRLDTGVKRSAHDERCRNISRRHLGISWFLGVLFLSTCVVRATQFGQFSKKGTIVIILGAMGHQSSWSRSISAQGRLSRCPTRSDLDTSRFVCRESQLINGFYGRSRLTATFHKLSRRGLRSGSMGLLPPRRKFRCHHNWHRAVLPDPTRHQI